MHVEWYTKPLPKMQVTWIKPHYTKNYSLNLPDGSRLKVKSGTQIIDRFWDHLRTYLKGTGRVPGSDVLTRRISAAQFTYWNRSRNLWQATGTMLRALYDQP